MLKMKLSKTYDLITGQIKSEFLKQFILQQIRIIILYKKNIL